MSEKVTLLEKSVFVLLELLYQVIKSYQNFNYINDFLIINRKKVCIFGVSLKTSKNVFSYSSYRHIIYVKF